MFKGQGFQGFEMWTAPGLGPRTAQRRLRRGLLQPGAAGVAVRGAHLLQKLGKLGKTLDLSEVSLWSSLQFVDLIGSERAFEEIIARSWSATKWVSASRYQLCSVLENAEVFGTPHHLQVFRWWHEHSRRGRWRTLRHQQLGQRFGNLDETWSIRIFQSVSKKKWWDGFIEFKSLGHDSLDSPWFTPFVVSISVKRNRCNLRSFLRRSRQAPGPLRGRPGRSLPRFAEGSGRLWQQPASKKNLRLIKHLMKHLDQFDESFFGFAGKMWMCCVFYHYFSNLAFGEAFVPRRTCGAESHWSTSKDWTWGVPWPKMILSLPDVAEIFLVLKTFQGWIHWFQQKHWLKRPNWFATFLSKGLCLSKLHIAEFGAILAMVIVDGTTKLGVPRNQSTTFSWISAPRFQRMLCCDLRYVQILQSNVRQRRRTLQKVITKSIDGAHDSVLLTTVPWRFGVLEDDKVVFGPRFTLYLEIDTVSAFPYNPLKSSQWSVPSRWGLFFSAQLSERSLAACTCSWSASLLVPGLNPKQNMKTLQCWPWMINCFHFRIVIFSHLCRVALQGFDCLR